MCKKIDKKCQPFGKKLSENRRGGFFDSHCIVSCQLQGCRLIALSDYSLRSFNEILTTSNDYNLLSLAWPYRTCALPLIVTHDDVCTCTKHSN